MPTTSKQIPLTAEDRKKINRKAIIFYVFGVIGLALFIFSIYLIAQQVAVFNFILMIVGIALVTVAVIASRWTNKDLASGKKNVFFGTISDKQEIYTVKVSSVNSSSSSDFDSQYKVKLGEEWHVVEEKTYKNASPGQQIRIEKTTESETLLNTELSGTAKTQEPLSERNELIEDREYLVTPSQVSEKIVSNVKLTNYKPRKSKGEAGPDLFYLVIENELYSVPEATYYSITVKAPVEILKNKENNKVEQAYAITADGERVSILK